MFPERAILHKSNERTLHQTIFLNFNPYYLTICIVLVDREVRQTNELDRKMYIK